MYYKMYVCMYVCMYAPGVRDNELCGPRAAAQGCRAAAADGVLHSGLGAVALNHHTYTPHTPLRTHSLPVHTYIHTYIHMNIKYEHIQIIVTRTTELILIVCFEERY